MTEVTVSYSEEEFQKQKSIDDKLLMLFRLMAAQQATCCKTQNNFNQQIKILESRKWLDRVIVAIASSVATIGALLGIGGNNG
jgi:pantothenate kinase